MNHDKLFDFVVVALLVLVLVGVGGYLFKSNADFTGSFLRTFDLSEDPLSTEGFVPITVKLVGKDLIVEQGNKLLKIDTRPSDALAVAFKNGIPAYAEAKAFEEDGKQVC